MHLGVSQSMIQIFMAVELGNDFFFSGGGVVILMRNRVEGGFPLCAIRKIELSITKIELSLLSSAI